MTKWDEILTLPVQNPPSIDFSSADITWSRVEGWQDGIDRVALIPFARVNDFVRGESNLKDCPTRFHIEARRKRPPETNKPKVDGILEYILYWCSFGPDDHRKGGTIRPSRSNNAKRKMPVGRPNNKRGCVCHFIVKRLIADPAVALVIYNFEKHVDKQGLPCHGPQDEKAVGTHAMFAPYISEELRLQVLSLLHVGVPVEIIMQRHSESVEKQGGPSNRDDLLSHRYVRRLERKIRRSSYDLDPDDAVSVGLWVEANINHVFYHKDFSDSGPFTLGIQTEWQLQQMIKFCNRSIMISDSRFGTNKLKYPVHSLLALDSKKNAIPVAWIIAPQFSSEDVHMWLRELYNRVRSKDATWKLGGFIIDDPSADVNAIRGVFQCPVLLSFWRVRRSWHRNLIRKCPDNRICVQIFKRLGQAVSRICREHCNADIFEDILEEFVDNKNFVDYFKATWWPKLGVWCDALRTLPLASLESSAAIECYHDQLKLRLMSENDPTVHQCVDWLVHKLATKVHSYYWLDEFAEKDSFSRYWKDEWKGGSSLWTETSSISDTDVEYGVESAAIACHGKESPRTVVWNPGSEFAICECSRSRLGCLCNHVIKSIQLSRLRGLATSSISLHEYRKVLLKILHCPPSDSLIRDHCVALLLSVQSQINSFLNIESNQPIPLLPFSYKENETETGNFLACGKITRGSILESVDMDSCDSDESLVGKQRCPSTCCIHQNLNVAAESLLESLDNVDGTRDLKRKMARSELDSNSMVPKTHDNHALCIDMQEAPMVRILVDENISSHDVEDVTDKTQ